MRRTGLLWVGTALLLAGTPASACSIAPPPYPPPTPEQVRAGIRASQQGLWKRADLVFTAGVISIGRAQPAGYPGFRKAWLRPLALLKGSALPGRFTLQHEDMTSCGAYPVFDVLGGGKGRFYLVYARAGPIGNRTVLATVAVRDLVDPFARRAVAHVGLR